VCNSGKKQPQVGDTQITESRLRNQAGGLFAASEEQKAKLPAGLRPAGAPACEPGKSAPASTCDIRHRSQRRYALLIFTRNPKHRR
jgi:hypothetical protein